MLEGALWLEVEDGEEPDVALGYGLDWLGVRFLVLGAAAFSPDRAAGGHRGMDRAPERAREGDGRG